MKKESLTVKLKPPAGGSKNVSGNFGKFIGFLESFWDFWKVSGNFGKFLGILESFRDF